MQGQSRQQAKITRYGAADGLQESYIACGLQDTYGYIWFATRDGLVQYDGYQFKTYKAWPGDNCPLETNRIDYIQEQADHDILCYSGKQYYCFHRATGRFERLDTETRHESQALPRGKEAAERVMQLPEYRDVELKVRLIDRQGGIWIRSFRGLERVEFQPAPITPHKFSADEGEEHVRGIWADRKGRIWIADKNKFVRLFGNDRRPIGYLTSAGDISPTRQTFGHTVYGFHEDGEGNIWLGTKPDGLFRLTPKGSGYSLTRYGHDERNPNSLSSSNVYSICEDSRHRLWIGTHGGGLNLMQPQPDGSVRFIHRGNGLRGYPDDNTDNIRCMHLMEGDILLIGTTNGLITCHLTRQPDGINFHLLQRNPGDATSLSNNNVMGIEQDRRGHIYIATNGGGVNRIVSTDLLTDTVRFRSYTSLNGMASDACLNVFADSHQDLWIVSEMALMRMDTATGLFTNYMKGLFQGGFLFTETKPLCLSGGQMIIATNQGVLHFSLNDVKKSQYVPPILFTCPDTLTVEPGGESFTLEFAALDYNKNEDIIYAYKMVGLDREWHYTKDNHVNFSSLPPGKYLFCVRSTNGDGIWVDNEKCITIHRKAAFNETRWAWMLYGGLMLIFLFVAYKTWTYVSQLKREMSNYRLATGEQLEYMASRIKELMGRDSQLPPPTTAGLAEDEADDGFAERAAAFVEQNIGNSDLDVEQFAAAMFMSRSQLYLKSKKTFDMSPGNYIQHHRILKARQLLIHSSASVSEIAFACGFSDPKYFSRTFKKATGMNPTEYQKAQ